jgi:hypothetical protein
VNQNPVAGTIVDISQQPDPIGDEVPRNASRDKRYALIDNVGSRSFGQVLVLVDDETLIFLEKNGIDTLVNQDRDPAHDPIQVGQNVRVEFEQPPVGSDPPQARATKLVIIQS